MVNKRNIKQKAEKLADEMADRPYGEEKEEIISKSISIPKSLYKTLEKIALNNKHEEKEPKSVSALIRVAVDEHLVKNNY